MGRPLAELVVSKDEREQLVRWSRRATSAQSLALRCRIVLACDSGKSNTEVAAECDVSLPTVGKWRQRFIDQRLEGLHDEPRPGAPRTVTDEQVEAVVVKTLESHSEECRALEHTVDGTGHGALAIGHRAHLARLRTSAASSRDV